MTQPGYDLPPQANLLGQEGRASDNLLALSVISRLINTHLDPQELCDTVVQLLQQSFGYDRVSVATVESAALLPPGTDWDAPAIAASLPNVVPWFASQNFYTVPRAGEQLSTTELSQWRLVRRAAGGDSYAPASSPLNLGLVGRVACTGQAALLVDVKSDPDYVELLPGTLSEITVPLALQQEVQGILNVESIKRALDEHDFILLRAVADLLSVALHNARLYQQAQRERDAARRSADLLLALHHISHEVLTLPRLEEILERITSAAMEISGGVYASLHLPTPPEGQELMLVAPRSTMPMPQERVQRYRTLAGQGVIGMCFAQGAIFVIQDTQDDPRIARNPIVRRWHIRSVMTLPLIVRDRTLGVLSVGHSAPAKFSPELQQALALLADQAAIAIRRARLNEELQEALERATELDHLKDHFLLMASHELRTPLTAVMGFLELLSEYPGKLADEPAQHFLNRARTGAEELTLLLGNILDGTQGSLDRSKLLFEEIELAPLVNRILPLIAARARHTLLSRVPEKLYIWADEMKVQQVLLNLLANAVKYSPSDTTITIDAQRDEVAGMVIVRVRDKGFGIAPEDQPRLFQKFVRLNEGINTTVRGTGLGLYISRLLVEGMDGQIGVQSDTDQGSTFWFRLPMRSLSH